jgi:hypothetical protein
MADSQRFTYRVLAASSADAIGRAKETCRAEGWTLRTVAVARQAETPGQWLVTLVVRPKPVPA